MTTETKMDAALSRFETALEHVEAAFASLAAAQSRAVEGAAGDAALRAEKARLEEELKTLRDRAGEISDLNRQAMLRIDKAMSRIRAVLQG